MLFSCLVKAIKTEFIKLLVVVRVGISLDFNFLKFLSPVKKAVKLRLPRQNLFDKRVLTQLTLSELKSLRENLSIENTAESVEKFSHLVRNYFKTSLRLHKELTLEELAVAVSARHELSAFREELLDFLRKLAEIEYSGREVKPSELTDLLNELEGVIEKLSRNQN
jgi:hypothetical protein